MARVFMLGATGTIGQATVRALRQRGHEVVCFVRPRAGVGGRLQRADTERLLAGATVRFGDVSQPASLREMVLLSAICVQKPRLAFQQAKLAFEAALMASGLAYAIVRPTAFFKSLSGQLERLKQGKPFLIFGNGELTACKPISDADLADYLADCLHNPERRNRILPIGGPGPALTAREQGELLFAALGVAPKFKSVPVGLMDAIIGTLATLGRVVPKLAEKAELARIGRYYATESMLVWDAAAGRYDAAATPSTGRQTLAAFYAGLASGSEPLPERGDHAVF
jgi:divinyl chlorophyllide a 8-vinyl-reductase